MAILNLTSDDLLDMVNPTRDPKIFRVGDSPGMISTAKVENIIDTQGSMILSSLAEKYSRILRGNIEGQYLTNKQFGATDGQTDLQLSFLPADNIRLFLNYFGTKSTYPERTADDEIAADAFSYNDTTGVITLDTPLAQGDQVIADYTFTPDRIHFPSVKYLILFACRIEFYNIFPSYNDASAVIKEGRDWLDSTLARYQLGTGIGEIDELQLVTPTERTTGRGYRIPFMGGRP